MEPVSGMHKSCAVALTIMCEFSMGTSRNSAIKIYDALQPRRSVT